MLTALDETILSTIARRPIISHKGNFGRVCCIGGISGMEARLF